MHNAHERTQIRDLWTNYNLDKIRYFQSTISTLIPQTATLGYEDSVMSDFHTFTFQVC